MKNAFVFICCIQSIATRQGVRFKLIAAQHINLNQPRMRRITQLLTVMCGIMASVDALSYIVRYEMKKARCLNPPRTARRVESVIGDCQEEVKNQLVNGESWL